MNQGGLPTYIDGCNLQLNKRMSPVTSTMELYPAFKEQTKEWLVCQVIRVQKSDNLNREETQKRIELIRSMGFKGYLEIKSYTLNTEALFVFYGLEQGESIESMLSLFARTALSPTEVVRIGVMLLDSYKNFDLRGFNHQEIE